MSGLADLQGRIRQALLAGDAVTLEPLLTGGRDARKRLAIHQRHYLTSLITAILDRFPATVWLAGSALVTEAARQFVRLHPPVRPCIAEYGDDFPAFLAAWPEAAHLQYLRDFAELERRFGQVAIEVDRPSVPVADIAALDHETLADAVVELQPGLRYWHASWPVDELFNAYLTDSAPDRFQMNLGSVYLEVHGARGDVCIGRLSCGDFRFRTALVAGRSLEQAMEHSVEADPRFDPSQAFVTLLADGLVTHVGVRQTGGVQ